MTACGLDNQSILLLWLLIITPKTLVDVEARTVVRLSEFILLRIKNLSHIGDHVWQLSTQLKFLSILFESFFLVFGLFVKICKFVFLTTEGGFHFLDLGFELVVGHFVHFG